MRFLHLSDLHLGRSLCEYSLLEDQRYWCQGLLDYLETAPCDAVLIAGDLYDRSVPSAGAVELCDWFLGELAGRLALPVLCVSGNHDSPQRLGFASSLYRASGLYMAAIPRREVSSVTLRPTSPPGMAGPSSRSGRSTPSRTPTRRCWRRTGSGWSAAPGGCWWLTASSPGGRTGTVPAWPSAIRR